MNYKMQRGGVRLRTTVTLLQKHERAKHLFPIHVSLTRPAPDDNTLSGYCSRPNYSSSKTYATQN
ncbi:hypothetical protein AciX9_1533 [Granulicella tundricola MP5ACTX9]|uniref:Uncharacterized protein n=1 Tax=Granulicella tundricola (strain ATCC BAA-1859 / DSM 23138 / MP5ACTX9) TaxID=1198114 RepID=E8WX25_GRATM|nr:hypothetical protein AciX9_1533 [Granulicella tundricola MP5ACTX9]